MRKRLIVGMLCAGFTFLIANAFASPINLPTGIKSQEGLKMNDTPKIDADDVYARMMNFLNMDIELSSGFLNDYVGERKLSKYSGKASFDIVGGEIVVSIMKTVDIYTMLGSAQSPEISGSGYKWDFSDSFMWGVGASAELYDWKAPGIQFFGDGNYRQSNGMDFDSITVDGTTYSKSQFGGSADWQEWQAALGVSKTFKYVIPYGGVFYSDVKTSAKVTVSGTSHDIDSESSQDKVGPFVGISILPTNWLSIDITGRFVAEEAVSSAVTVKF